MSNFSGGPDDDHGSNDYCSYYDRVLVLQQFERDGCTDAEESQETHDARGARCGGEEPTRQGCKHPCTGTPECGSHGGSARPTAFPVLQLQHDHETEEAGEEEKDQDIRPSHDGPLEPEAVAWNAENRNGEKHSEGEHRNADKNSLPPLCLEGT